jgi:regulator of sirC expression with transglutaminase-like and TPR domain
LRDAPADWKIWFVEPDSLNSQLRTALLSLLDDPSPEVRKAMLARFQAMGRDSERFLKEIVAGPNRILSWHARWFLAELKFADPVADFVEFIHSMNYELETGALLMSRTVNTDVDVGACCTQLDEIARRARELIIEPATLRDKCRILNRVLLHEYGFHGDNEDYSNPLNSFLDQVLKRRKGLPVSLSIIYLLVAQRLGMALEPVGLPGHFVVGCYADGSPFFVDVFDNGRLLSTDDVFTLLRRNHVSPRVTDLAPTPVREVLLRCCRNLSNHYAGAGEPQLARMFSEFIDEFEDTYARESSA